jgi:hypothetical protein
MQVVMRTTYSSHSKQLSGHFMATLGESNVIELFSTSVDRACSQKLSNSARYIKANLSGKADRHFADFFLGVSFSNLLIEFKDTVNELSSERKKPLRKKLCSDIEDRNLMYSRSCHYLGWGVYPEANTFTLSFSIYLSDVCTRLNFEKEKFGLHREWCLQSFLDGIFKQKIGLSSPKFINYLVYLFELDTPPDPDSQSKIPFPAQIISYSESHGVLSTPIYTLADLNKFSDLLSRYESVNANNNLAHSDSEAAHGISEMMQREP